HAAALLSAEGRKRTLRRRFCVRYRAAVRCRVAFLTLVSVAACARGAVSLTGPSATACRPDLRLLAGACVSPRVAEEYCGATMVPDADGCTPRPRCERGRAR